MVEAVVSSRPLPGHAHDVLIKEADALAYAWQRFGVGARLQYPRGGRILDQGPEAYIVVEPPAGVVQLPAANSSAKLRRLHDRKTLTPRGVQASQGGVRGARGGSLLGRGANVWLMEVTSWGADCTLVYTATIEQIVAREVRVHERHAPPHGQAATDVEVTSASCLAAASAAFVRADGLKAEAMALALAERRRAQQAAGAAGVRQPEVNGAATAAAVAALEVQVGDAEREAARLRRAGKSNQYTREHRDRIHALTSEGHAASMVSQIMIEERAAGGFLCAPPVAYIQGVQDKWRRSARENCKPYVAVDRLNRGALAASYVCIHYQRDLPGAASNTDGEMHISIYATLGMIAAARGAEVANLDTKWRTRADGGCVSLGRVCH